ncbi:MAG: response regulator [Fimbriimonadaceae bacterium]|nr:response regulator [Fimbriimonadaceae bacterium]
MPDGPPDRTVFVEALTETRLAQIRHDLRTPLNAIIGYSEMLIEELVDRGAGDLAGDLEKVRSSGTRLLGLIDRYLRPQQPAEQPVEAEAVSAAKGADDAIRPVAPAEVTGEVLVVDDVAENREVLARYLRRMGHRVRGAAGGREALEMVGEAPPDVVLLDVMMPEMDGFEVLKRLKGDETTREVPVLMVSALDQLETVVACIQAGAEDYLPKPFNPIVLRARIGACLDKKRMRQRELEYLAEIRAEREKSDRLLLNILPQAVADRLKLGEGIIADSVLEAAVLFADLVGFTEFAGAHSPKEVVGSLDEIFSTFDRIAERHGLEKIKTIGDAYMVVGGLPPIGDPRLESMVLFAREIVSALDEINDRRGTAFRLRTGIHAGPVVAGVIGRTKFAYDLWGDTVNVAQRMEATGIAGRIQVSDGVRSRLGNRFSWIPRGEIEVKGKGLMSVWLLDDGR